MIWKQVKRLPADSQGHAPAGAEGLPLYLGLPLWDDLPCPSHRRGLGLASRRHRGDESHLAEIFQAVSPNAHALRVLDIAVWRSSPHGPELILVENVGHFSRRIRFANRLFDNYEAIVDACCEAWNAHLTSPDRITLSPHAVGRRSVPDAAGMRCHAVRRLGVRESRLDVNASNQVSSFLHVMK